jgi:hypothetical protein
MPVHKRKYISGKTVWFYQFDVPGSTRTTRRLVKGSGFATKGDAIDAEAAKRIEEQQKFDLAKRGGGAEPIPTTLKMLLDEFRCQHAQEELAPKTVERYPGAGGVHLAGTVGEAARRDHATAPHS